MRFPFNLSIEWENGGKQRPQTENHWQTIASVKQRHREGDSRATAPFDTQITVIEIANNTSSNSGRQNEKKMIL